MSKPEKPPIIQLHDALAMGEFKEMIKLLDTLRTNKKPLKSHETITISSLISGIDVISAYGGDSEEIGVVRKKLEWFESLEKLNHDPASSAFKRYDDRSQPRIPLAGKPETNKTK